MSESNEKKMSENNEKGKKELKETEQEKEEVTEEEDETKTEIEEELERLRMEAESARAEAESARNRMLRTVADYENYKKRLEKEKKEFMKYANERFIKDLLPSLDDLERAIISSNDSSDLESLREGVQIIYKQLNNILEKYDVTPIEAVGKKFNPNLHEAIMHMPSKNPKNTIIEEYQKGYKLHDRVIRPSKVVISAGSSDEEEEE